MTKASPSRDGGKAGKAEERFRGMRPLDDVAGWEVRLTGDHVVLRYRLSDHPRVLAKIWDLITEQGKVDAATNQDAADGR